MVKSGIVQKKKSGNTRGSPGSVAKIGKGISEVISGIVRGLGIIAIRLFFRSRNKAAPGFSIGNT